MLHSLKKPICIPMMLILMMILSVPAFAAESKKVVRVAFPRQADLTEISADGSLSGYTYDYLEKISLFTGWTMEYVLIDEPTLDESLLKSLEMVQSGEVDLVGCLAKSPALEEQFEYTQNSYGTMYSTISAREDNAALNSSNFFLKNPLRVGVRGDADQTKKDLVDYLTSHGIAYEFVEYARHQQLLDAFARGEVDVVPDISIGSIKGTRMLVTYASKFFYFASAKGNTALISELDAALVTLNQNFPVFQETLAINYTNNTPGGFFITAQENAYLQEKRTLRALCVPDCAPFVFLNAEGQLRGIAISMMEDFAKQAGLTMEYTLYDRSKDFLDTFRNGEFDCILGIPVNDAYNAKIGVITSMPYLGTEQVYFSKHNVLQKPMIEATVAMLRGSSLESKVNCKRILFYDTIEQCIHAVVSGIADGGFGNQYCVEYYSQHNFSNLAIVPMPGETRNMEISVSKSENYALLALINRYIENMDSSQIYAFHVAANEEHLNNWFRVLLFSDPLKASVLIALFACSIFLAICMYFFARSSGKKNQQLQIASNAKSDFLSRVSHDMRTPMNAILSFSAMELDKELSQKQLVADMAQINRSGRYLLGLINDVLDMSKIENSKMDLRLQPIVQSELTEAVLATVGPLMKENKLCFCVEQDRTAEEPLLLCDIMRTKQILINLLSNAAKFTPEGGTVTFCIERTELNEQFAVYRFTVRDTGIGMSEEFQKHLFEPFSQERNEKTGLLTGTGLGLAIVKQLVDLMGGTISVKSRQNSGSEFVVELKNQLAPLANAPAPKSAAASVLSNELLKGKRILLCEDHPINAEIAKRMLLKKEMAVEHAENGQLAVEMFSASSIGYYDAVLMDIKMPVLDGLSAAREIRSLLRKDAKTIPIIAITANAFDEDVEKSQQAGMNAHLSKPIDPSHLYRTLCEFIANKPDN